MSGTTSDHVKRTSQLSKYNLIKFLPDSLKLIIQAPYSVMISCISVVLHQEANVYATFLESSTSVFLDLQICAVDRTVSTALAIENMPTNTLRADLSCCILFVCSIYEPKIKKNHRNVYTVTVFLANSGESMTMLRRVPGRWQPCGAGCSHTQFVAIGKVITVIRIYPTKSFCI